MTGLTVLLLESDRGAAEGAARALEAAGHSVVHCHDDGAAAFPCNALLEDHDCPVRNGVVDVALTMRGRPRSAPAPHEDGVRCALEQHVPVVVAGSTVLNPFDDYATIVHEGDDGVVAACEQAAALPIRKHSEVASASAQDTLADPTASAVVHRSNGRLVVTMTTAVGDEKRRAMASVRVIAALRAVDRDAAGVDVKFAG